MSFSYVYVPVGVPTFHLESASDLFARSAALLRSLDENVCVPEEMLLSVDAVKAFLADQQPDALIFQNLTFANAAYMSEVLRVFDGPVLLWTLREPVIDGTRLRLNSLTGAFSAGNTLRAFRGEEAFSYVFGNPEEEEVQNAVRAFLQATRIKKALRSLRIAAVGHTPQGFGFGRALDAEMMKTFGAELTAIEARELIDKAKAYSDEEITDWLKKTENAVVGLDSVPSARQRSIAAWIAGMRASPWPSHASGSTRFSADGASPTSALAFSGVMAAWTVSLTMTTGLRPQAPRQETISSVKSPSSEFGFCSLVPVAS